MIISYKGKSPEIDSSVFVAHSADVIGDVRIGRESSVWFGAVVRGDTASITVGEQTSIQDNVTVHCDDPMRIGNHVTIGHNAIIHCAEIGDGCLIGMGAVLLAGAVIGRNCIIGAGAVVKEGAVVPDNTLMAGVPAKAIRSVAPDTVESWGLHRHYAELSRGYTEP